MKVKKINLELKRKISEIIQNDLKDPRLDIAGIITITSVETTKDLDLAKVYVSVFANELPKEGLIHILEGSQNHIKKLLYKRMMIRKIPNLRFYLDNTLEYAEKIDDLMVKIGEVDNNQE